MKYTPSQIKAYSESGENILVSAGAGSGKTGVLKKRVVEKLIKGIHIDDLIILTFTKAAANEMKTRIIDAINLVPVLKPELDRVDQAIITTFDAFCLKLVKENHYLLDLPSTISIGDKIQFLTMERNVLEETLKESYLEGDSIFNRMVIDTFQKGDDLIYKSVLDLAHKLTKSPNYKNIIHTFEGKYFSSKTLESSFYEFESSLREKLAIVNKANRLLNQRLSVFNHPKINEYLNNLSGLVTSLNTADTDDLLVKLNLLELPRKPSIRNNEEIKAEINYYQPKVVQPLKELKEIVSKLNITSKKQAIDRVLSTKVNTLKIVELADKFLDKLNLKKKELNLYSYQDIMDLATKLLEEHSEIRDYYKNKIDEIMIDEYQDTNDLQVYFVSLIADNNLFMVGDIKQSIYGFRDANPKNFAEKYKLYGNHSGGMLINLRENFRSRRQILDDINKTFNHIMSEDIGGINYQDNQSLVYGLKLYDNEIENQHYGLDFLKYDVESEKETNEFITKTDIEGELLAKDILNKISNNYQILDGADSRDIRYSDIAVLIDRKTSFNQLSEILSKYKIPVNLYSDEPFIESPEMLFLTSFVKFINCFIDETYLKENFQRLFMSIARSFVFKVNDKEIINFLTNEKIETINDLVRLDDYIVFSGIYTLSLSIKDLVNELPIYKLMEHIYIKLDIYRCISYLDNPRKKEEKLDFFLKTLMAFEHFNFSDLINYLDEIEDNKDWDIEYSQINSGIDAVKLMTMHKSKGLQFPVVYCPGLYKKFNYTENKDFYIYDLNYGLIGQAMDEGFHTTYLRNLSLDRTKKEYISERIRLLYVAFTRAKENLVLFADYGDLLEDKDLIENDYISNQIRLKYNSFTNMLSSTSIRDIGNTNKFNIDLDSSPKTSIDVEEHLLERRAFDIHKQSIEASRFSKTEVSLFNDETIETIEYGNFVHKCLENIDFNNLNHSIKNLPMNIRHSFETLLKSEIFNLNTLKQVYQEFEFIEETDSDSKHGIIDLMVEYDDIIYIVDYKLKSISDYAYQKQLNGYRAYIKNSSNKEVKCFLYSIIDQLLQEILE